MEKEGARVRRDVGIKLPNHFAIFCVVLKSAKGLLCVPIDVEARISDETLASELRTLDSFRHVIAERVLGIGFWLRDKVAPNPNEYAIRLNHARGTLSRSVGPIDDLQSLR